MVSHSPLSLQDALSAGFHSQIFMEISLAGTGALDRGARYVAGTTHFSSGTFSAEISLPFLNHLIMVVGPTQSVSLPLLPERCGFFFISLVTGILFLSSSGDS